MCTVARLLTGIQERANQSLSVVSMGAFLWENPGGVRTKTAMHYFDEFPTWRNFVVMRAVFRVSLIIVCTTFAGLFSATILDLESSGIVK